MNKRALWTAAVALAACAASAAVEVSFARGKWNPADWTIVKGPHWIKAAAILLPTEAWLKANEKHLLSVKVARDAKGRKETTCTSGGYTLSCVDDTLPDSFYAGILGCEGRNFFWDFSVR